MEAGSDTQQSGEQVVSESDVQQITLTQVKLVAEDGARGSVQTDCAL